MVRGRCSISDSFGAPWTLTATTGVAPGNGGYGDLGKVAERVGKSPDESDLTDHRLGRPGQQLHPGSSRFERDYLAGRVEQLPERPDRTAVPGAANHMAV